MPYYGDGLPYYYGSSYANHSSLMTGTTRIHAPLSRFSPHLSTITESPLSSIHRYSPVSVVPRPRRVVDTADIDVSTPRILSRDGSRQRNRLRRDRPTIKIRSQALKDNPALREHNEKHEKSVGELLMEKFLIKEKKQETEPDRGGVRLFHQVSLDRTEETDPVPSKITRRFTRRRSSADIQLDPEQLQREVAYAQVQAEVLDSLVAEEQAVLENEVRRGTLVRKGTTGGPHTVPTFYNMNYPQSQEESDAATQKTKKPLKKVKKKRKPTEKLRPEDEEAGTSTSSDLDIRREDPGQEETKPQMYKIEASNSVGDFSTIWVNASGDAGSGRTVEQFRESVRIPVPRKVLEKELSVTVEETETEVILPVKKPYVKDTSRNSVYFTVKTPPDVKEPRKFDRPEDGRSLRNGIDGAGLNFDLSGGRTDSLTNGEGAFARVNDGGWKGEGKGVESELTDIPDDEGFVSPFSAEEPVKGEDPGCTSNGDISLEKKPLDAQKDVEANRKDLLGKFNREEKNNLAEKKPERKKGKDEEPTLKTTKEGTIPNGDLPPWKKPTSPSPKDKATLPSPEALKLKGPEKLDKKQPEPDKDGKKANANTAEANVPPESKLSEEGKKKRDAASAEKISGGAEVVPRPSRLPKPSKINTDENNAVEAPELSSGGPTYLANPSKTERDEDVEGRSPTWPVKKPEKSATLPGSIPSNVPGDACCVKEPSTVGLKPGNQGSEATAGEKDATLLKKARYDTKKLGEPGQPEAGRNSAKSFTVNPPEKVEPAGGTLERAEKVGDKVKADGEKGKATVVTESPKLGGRKAAEGKEKVEEKPLGSPKVSSSAEGSGGQDRSRIPIGERRIVLREPLPEAPKTETSKGQATPEKPGGMIEEKGSKAVGALGSKLEKGEEKKGVKTDDNKGAKVSRIGLGKPTELGKVSAEAGKGKEAGSLPGSPKTPGSESRFPWKVKLAEPKPPAEKPKVASKPVAVEPAKAVAKKPLKLSTGEALKLEACKTTEAPASSKPTTKTQSTEPQKESKFPENGELAEDTLGALSKSASTESIDFWSVISPESPNVSKARVPFGFQSPAQPQPPGPEGPTPSDATRLASEKPEEEKKQEEASNENDKKKETDPKISPSPSTPGSNIPLIEEKRNDPAGGDGTVKPKTEKEPEPRAEKGKDGPVKKEPKKKRDLHIAIVKEKQKKGEDSSSASTLTPNSLANTPSTSVPASEVSTPVAEISLPVINIVAAPTPTTTSSGSPDEEGEDPGTPTNEEKEPGLARISKWENQTDLSNAEEKDVAPVRKAAGSEPGSVRETPLTSPAVTPSGTPSSTPGGTPESSKKKKVVKRKKNSTTKKSSVQEKPEREPKDSRKESTAEKSSLKPPETTSPRLSPRNTPNQRPLDLIKMFYTTPSALLTATPRDLSKVRRAKIKRRKHASRTPSVSSDSTGSTTSTATTGSSGSTCTELDDDPEHKRMNSTRSNDSGFDGSPRISTPSQSLDNQRNSDSSDHFASGRITPPATNLPRFKKYAVTDFNFLKVLGKGSFGKVLLAELRGTECVYAVKCLKKDVVLEDDDVECTLIERKVLTLATRHPYLCHLFCTFQTESHLFFVMEYLNGGDLMFHIQKSGRFPESRARFYAAEIWSGLNFLHKKGIVYRDLKLDNVLLDFEGHIRIADFGMCKLQIFLDRTADTFCGTPDYMAPEIIKGLKYNQAVDWWSYGVLLYEMLTGQSPFSGCDEDELFWSICNERPFIPRYLSQEATDMLVCILEKDSGKRLPGYEIAMHPFFQSLPWDRLERRQLEPPFKPALDHTLDTKYFDTAFTAERPRLTPVPEQILTSMDQGVFRGFSYTNPNATD